MTKIKTSPPASLTLIEHLDELRSRLLLCVIAVFISTLSAFLFSKHLIAYLKWPASNVIDHFILIKPTEIITVYFKVALYVGLIVSAPIIVFQAWRYIQPALSQQPKLNVFPWIITAIILFFGGTCFTFFIIIPQSLSFLMYLAQDSALPMLTLNFYTSFMLALLTLGGSIFEIPVVAALLTKIGFITPTMMKEKRRVAIIIILIIAAILTPTTDIFNLLLFAIPMLLLYEVGIWFSILNSNKLS